MDLIWIWLDFGWIWFDFGWIWLDLAWLDLAKQNPARILIEIL